MDEFLKNINISKFIKYAYAGFLFFVFIGIYNIQYLKYILQSGKEINTTVLIIICLCCGALIYLLYRYLIGELIIYPFAHYIHYKIINLRHGSLRQFLIVNKLEKIPIRSAYNYLRNQIPKAEQEYINFEHSEIHIVYLTSVALFFSLIANLILNIYLNNYTVKWHFYFLHGFIFLIVLFCGIRMDIKQHEKELRIVLNDKKSFTSDIKEYFNA